MAARIVARLAREASSRRALFDQHGVASAQEYARRTGERLPIVRLMVNGADRLVGSSEGDASPLLRPIAALAADAPDTGIGIVLAGSPAIVGKRMTQRATRRFVLFCVDDSLYSLTGVPRDAVVEFETEGRGYDVSTNQAMQWGSLTSDEHSAGEVLDALGNRLREVWADEFDAVPEPLPEVRWPLPWSRVDADTLVQPPGYEGALAIGVDTDTAMWTWVDAVDDGPLVAVGGPGKSGRSSTLLAFAASAKALGWRVGAVAPTRRSPLTRLEDHGVAVTASLADLEVATAPQVVLVDDANRLGDESQALNKLIEESTAPYWSCSRVQRRCSARRPDYCGGLRTSGSR